MVKEIRYTNIKRVLDNLHDHPMLADLTLEQVVRHTIRFIGIHGYTKLYENKIDTVDIHEFRGELPCDLISIDQVRDCRTKICMRSMTNTFTPGLLPPPPHHHPHDHPHDIHEHHGPHDHHGHHKHDKFPFGEYIPPYPLHLEELSFKTQGRIIFTSFPEGRVEIAYKSIPVDEDGFPKLIDNENYLACLEAYIKKQVFTVKFDQGKIAAGILENAKQEYAWLAGQLNSEMVLPSQSEMESITRMWNTLIKPVRHFDDGFRHLGDREYIRKH
jgi:hypothetical protein